MRVGFIAFSLLLGLALSAIWIRDARYRQFVSRATAAFVIAALFFDIVVFVRIIVQDAQREAVRAINTTSASPASQNTSPSFTPTPIPEFVDDAVTPDYLFSLSDGRTTTQFNALTKEFLGKYISVIGVVDDVVPMKAFLEKSDGAMIFLFQGRAFENKASIQAIVRSDFVAPALQLRQNDKVMLAGQIADISWDSIRIERAIFRVMPPELEPPKSDKHRKIK